MKTRILAMLLVVIMVVALVPANVFAAESAPALPEAKATLIGRDITVPTVDGEQVPVTFAMNFLAVEPSEEQFEYYKKWYADYVLTINKDVTGMDGYLIGQYDWFNENWLKIAVETEDVIIKANEPFKVMYNLAQSYDENSTYISYEQIVNSVKDFDCGIYFTPEFLQANPDLEVTLELRIYNLHDMEENYRIGDAYVFTPDVQVERPELPEAKATLIGRDITVPTVDGEQVPVTFAMNFLAVEPSEEQFEYYKKWYADYVLTINKDVTGMDGYLIGQYDWFNENWLKIAVETEDVIIKANEPFKVMYNLAQSYDENSTYISYEQIVNSVKDFDCGIYFTPEYLAENPDLEVTLELRIYNLHDMDENYRIGSAYTFHPLTITQQPQNAIASENSTFTFSVEAVGTGLTYQWQRLKNGYWIDTTFAGSTENTLSVKAVEKNQMPYRCVITDSYGTKITTEEVTFEMTEAVSLVTIVNQPVTVTARKGADVQFNVGLSSVEGVSYRWQKSSDKETWSYTSISGYNTDTISMTVADSKKLYYRCQITDAAGTVIYSEPATFEYEALPAVPEITVNDRKRYGLEGELVEISVTASDTNVTYQWQRSKDGVTWANTEMSGYNTDTLSFHIYASTTAGYRYRCVIKDEYGRKVYSRSTTVNVITPFSITTEPVDVIVEEGGVAEFTVAAQGTGLRYRWKRLKPNATTYNYTSLEGYNTPTLKVPAIAKNKMPYICEVTDLSGAVLYSQVVTFSFE